jgi:hypothetical protein
MRSFRLTAAVLSTLVLGACASTMGGALPTRGPSAPAEFRAGDFAWSQKAGRNTVAGQLVFRRGQTRFSCSGAGVVLTPDTPWSRRRMTVLYGPGDHAALPASEVRARTPSAPAGDVAPFIKRTTCDANDRFSVAGLPDGAWFVITLARPVGQPQAEGYALMRRVVTRGGRTTQAEL